MNRRSILHALAAAALGAAVPGARAQRTVKRVGILGRQSVDGIFDHWKERFPKEFAAHGFVEGRNLELLWFAVPSPVSGPDRTLDLAQLRANVRRTALEMTRSELDCAVTHGEPGTRFLQEATRTIPIVADVQDPVGMGFAQSLARPGGNITGLHQGEREMALKTAELIRKLFPRIPCVGWVGTDTLLRHAAAVEEASSAFDIRVRRLVLRSTDREGFAALSRDMAALRRDGCLAAQAIMPSLELGAAVQAIALEERVALVGGEVDRDGALFRFNPQRVPEHRSAKRIPAIVARILRGERPADIPFEGPSGYHLEFSMKTAARLGIAVPADVQMQSERLFR